jgi:hypothetical protein
VHGDHRLNGLNGLNRDHGADGLNGDPALNKTKSFFCFFIAISEFEKLLALRGSRLTL